MTLGKGVARHVGRQVRKPAGRCPVRRPDFPSID
jgi:hypothetical protein